VGQHKVFSHQMKGKWQISIWDLRFSWQQVWKLVFWDIARCSLIEVNLRFRGTYASIVRVVVMMEAVHTSETLVYFNETTWCYIPEGCNLQAGLVSLISREWFTRNGCDMYECKLHVLP
jgi:hypothetical protein